LELVAAAVLEVVVE
jgi:hypothetical protein